MKYKETNYGGGFSIAYLGPPKKWKRIIAGVFRNAKNKTPRGPAYRRMVRNGII